MIRCKLGIHKYVDVEHQTTKNIAFGFTGAELPGWRLIQKCSVPWCNKRRVIKLNMKMPNKYLYMESIWK